MGRVTRINEARPPSNSGSHQHREAEGLKREQGISRILLCAGAQEESVAPY